MKKSAQRAFGPEWLTARLRALLPGYPRVELCVALSGGADSTALLAALALRRRSRSGLRAIHVDHGLHPDSAAWAAHCRRLAGRFGVPIETFTADVRCPPGGSLEAAARAARYAILARELREGEVMLTAHHEDDQLETVLLQLLRGAGLPGLAAMPEVAPFARGRLARPLLGVSRAQIEEWLRSRGLEWIDDRSNVDERFDRNYLRHRVLPLIRARWPAAARSVARSARHAAEAQRLLDALGRADVERAACGADLSVPALRALDPDRRRNALRFWIAQSGRTVPDAARLEELAGPVLAARPDANPAVAWNGVVVRRHGERLSIRDQAPFVPPEPLTWNHTASPRLALPAGLGELELGRSAHGPLDLDRLPPRITVRWRRGGERLRPAAGGPSRTLKALLQTARVPLEERARLPLLFDGERLIAVADRWLDASIRASAATRRRGRLVWHRTPERIAPR